MLLKPTHKFDIACIIKVEKKKKHSHHERFKARVQLRAFHVTPGLLLLLWQRVWAKPPGNESAVQLHTVLEPMLFLRLCVCLVLKRQRSASRSCQSFLELLKPQRKSSSNMLSMWKKRGSKKSAKEESAMISKSVRHARITQANHNTSPSFRSMTSPPRSARRNSTSPRTKSHWHGSLPSPLHSPAALAAPLQPPTPRNRIRTSR